MRDASAVVDPPNSDLTYQRAKDSFARRPAGTHFDLTRSEVEDLLAYFLEGTQCVKLETRLKEVHNLPSECRKHLQLAESGGRAWTAWSS